MDILVEYGHVLAAGFLRTIELFLLAAAGSLVLGTILATLRVSPVPALRAVGTGYVTLLRNTPLTLVFFFFVFAYPKLELVQFPFFTASVIALTIYTSAFVCEVLRAGINTVPVGQAEAARSIGLGFAQSLTSVILPQAFRAVVPPLVSVLIALLKNTTVAAGFSVDEVGSVIPFLNEVGEPTTNAFVWIAVGFLVLVIPLTLVQRSFEKRWSVAR
ncbi:amino acid ABC transporter permease [Saccharopolyspora taberi]|uniref:amino acid ABC transporter permease n=1 Tax=Saccharopolyspora taberi TaxID=60895 RepID=UPI0031DC3810